jgi:hypothetical protein
MASGRFIAEVADPAGFAVCIPDMVDFTELLFSDTVALVCRILEVMDCDGFDWPVGVWPALKRDLSDAPASRVEAVGICLKVRALGSIS